VANKIFVKVNVCLSLHFRPLDQILDEVLIDRWPDHRWWWGVGNGSQIRGSL